MNTVLDKLDLDKEQEAYYSLSRKEQEKLLEEILVYASENRAAIINYCHKIEPTQFCSLELIYEALAKDPDNWGEFIYEEFKRILSGAKNSTNPFHYTSCLDIGLYFEEKNKPFVEKIIKLLHHELDNPSDAIRFRALWWLSDWVADEYAVKYRSTIDKMAERINDSNWKIRFLTNLLFKDKIYASSYKLDLGFWDRIRGKFFSDVFEITT